MQPPSVKRGPGRPRKNPPVVTVGIDPAGAGRDSTACVTWQDGEIIAVDYGPAALAIPEDWNLGALLNVRNNGAEYLVSLYPEEYDPRRPERTLRFSNSADCQNFVSAWYARTYPC